VSQGAIRAWADEVGDAWVLGVVRVTVGVMLFLQALEAAEEVMTAGYFGDRFHLPFIPESLVPSRTVYLGMVAARILLAVMITVGHRARTALALGGVLGIYTLLLNRIEYHHNRYALYCYALLLALTPCDRALSLGYDGPSRGAPLWGQRLAQVQVGIVYLASGGSKLLDPDWRDGLVIADRFARYGYQALERGVPPAVVEAFSTPSATSALAKLAIATELFLVVGLFARRTRVFALWWATMFHLTIEISSQVEMFTWLTLTMLALFATPDFRARKVFFDPSRAKGRVLSRLIRALDWLARFEVKPWEPDRLRTGHVLVVVRRDGSRATGVRALAMCARCLPALFPLWAPLALVASFTRGGDASAHA
jgi:hypothetical protein